MKVNWWHVTLGFGFAVILVAVLSVVTAPLAAEAETGDYNANDCRRMGHACLERDEYEEALAWYERGLTLEPDDAFLLLGKAIALHEMGKSTEALESLDRALASEPGQGLIYKAKIAVLEDTGKLEEAVETCNEALAHTRGDRDLYRYKAESLVESGRYEEAARTLTRAAEMGFEDADSFVERAKEFLEYGDYETGASYAGAALALRPNDVGVLTLNGWALTFVEKYDDALECADRALALDAGRGATWTLKGVTLLHVGEAEAALPCFDRALELNVEQPDVYQLRGAAYFMQDKYAEARAAFESCLAFDGFEYVLLYLYVVDRVEGRAGVERLRPLLESQDDPWGRAIARFLAGETGADDLLTSAGADKYLRCEGYYYIGYKNKLDGDAAAARGHFEEAVATEGRHHLGYILSKHELRRSVAAGE